MASNMRRTSVDKDIYVTDLKKRLDTDVSTQAEECYDNERPRSEILDTWWFPVGRVCREAFYSKSLPVPVYIYRTFLECDQDSGSV